MFVTALCFAQEDTEKEIIKIEKKCLGTRYTYQGKPLIKLADFFPIIENSPEAVSQVQKARTNRGIASGFSFAGGFFIGWPAGQALVGAEDPNWVLAGVGGGLVVVGIVFGVKSDKQLKKGVNIYNESIALSDSEPHDFEIAFALNRIGINVLF